jgi:hypothetical protein
MILQIIRKKCLRFGVHVDIQVSYKILQLEILKESFILHHCLAFKKGYFEAVLTKKNTLCPVGVKASMTFCVIPMLIYNY